jgi:hypothetical protein
MIFDLTLTGAEFAALVRVDGGRMKHPLSPRLEGRLFELGLIERSGSSGVLNRTVGGVLRVAAGPVAAND